MRKIDVIILAAGKGTRMGNDSMPKILMKIGGNSILKMIVKTLLQSNIRTLNFVLGYKSENVIAELNLLGVNYNFTIQKELNGTAKSLEEGLKSFRLKGDNLLVLFGDDAGLYKPKTINNFIDSHISRSSKCTMLILNEKRSLDIGALKLNKNKEIVGVIPKSELKNGNKYVLCGAFCFNKNWINKNINNIKPSERSGEYPLPQIIDVATSQNIAINSFELKNLNEWESINDPIGLRLAEAKFKQKK